MVDKKIIMRVRDEVLSDEINKSLRDFFKSGGKDFHSGGIDPELLDKAIKIVGLNIKGGVYKFSDIVDDAVERLGDVVYEMLNELKAAYAAFYITTFSDEEAQKMEDLASIRKIKFDDVFIPKTNESYEKELGPIGKDWIEYLKEYNRGYFKELKKKGTLEKEAIKEEEEYHKNVEEIKARAIAEDKPYPPGGAEEVAKMFLFPELYP